MNKNIILLILCLLFLSCKQKVKIKSILNQDISFKNKVEYLLNSDIEELKYINNDLKENILTFYRNNNFKAQWLKSDTLSVLSNILIKNLNNSLAFGIPENRFPLIKNNSLPILKEVMLTINLKILHNDLMKGVMNDSLTKIKEIYFSNDFSFFNKLNKINSDSIANEIISWGPKDSLYNLTAKYLYKFYHNISKIDTFIYIPIQKDDSLKSINYTKVALFNKHYIDNPNVDTNILFSALRKFQYENGLKQDTKIGKWTAKSLMEKQIDKCRRIALNLEKLRHRKLKLDYFVEINIPEFKLRFFHFDTLKAIHKVIVGTTENQSPELESNIFRIITFPTWSVPFSITSKEFLPILKRNPNYLINNNMILLKNNEEINPIDVNWKKIPNKTFPYKVIQNSGKNNSLGILKFDFNNKFGVYVHDTPNKGLFNTIFRSYSHGCIRCENPVDLAKEILLTNEKNILPDTLDSLLTRKDHRYINLKTRIPIEIYYRTITIDENNNIILLPDLYERDKKIIKIMFSISDKSIQS